MSVRVVARIRPLLKLELDKDTIVHASATSGETPGSPTVVRIPNPKNEAESFSFQFNSVYDQSSTQQQIFDSEVAPTVKHLFNGFDVTLFAYGVTGTGKTHTMRGGKSLADRGVIPRLLSSIYRRARKVEKDSAGETTVEVAMSYYEIYNDRVYDLFEPPEKRTSAGLPIRDNNGKTVVVGLTERPCTTLKEFEHLYDQANVNRSTSATKLNAHSSRSHAILCVKVSQTTGDRVQMSTASAIDLAGSEDNRRTDNGKERLVESASINKSLFVLAQCVEAISKKQTRIPYRESKMTRILSLGQNNGLTIMILNLAPVRSYHLDTLSSLNFANRTKKIEICEVENEPLFRQGPKVAAASFTGPSIQRQPLRPLTGAHNARQSENGTKSEKPAKTFSVYSDKNKPIRQSVISGQGRKAEPPKHARDISINLSSLRLQKPAKPGEQLRFGQQRETPTLAEDTSAEMINQLVERRVDEILAARGLSNEPTTSKPEPHESVNAEMQSRLRRLEQLVEKHEDGRAREGLQYLFMARQHQEHGEDASALKMYKLALPFFPNMERLPKKIVALQRKLDSLKDEKSASSRVDSGLAPADSTDARRPSASEPAPAPRHHGSRKRSYIEGDAAEIEQDGDYVETYDDDAFSDDDEFAPKKLRQPRKGKLQVFSDHNRAASTYSSSSSYSDGSGAQSPRTSHLLNIINSRDISQIRLLRGVGAKKAEAIVRCLCEMDEQDHAITDLDQLGGLRGVGMKTVEKMREGVLVQ